MANAPQPSEPKKRYCDHGHPSNGSCGRYCCKDTR